MAGPGGVRWWPEGTGGCGGWGRLAAWRAGPGGRRGAGGREAGADCGGAAAPRARWRTEVGGGAGRSPASAGESGLSEREWGRCAPPDALGEIYGAGLCVLAPAGNLGSQLPGWL